MSQVKSLHQSVMTNVIATLWCSADQTARVQPNKPSAYCLGAAELPWHARFTKMTDTGKPKVDEATLSEIKDIAVQQEQ